MAGASSRRVDTAIVGKRLVCPDCGYDAFELFAEDAYTVEITSVLCRKCMCLQNGRSLTKL